MTRKKTIYLMETNEMTNEIMFCFLMLFITVAVAVVPFLIQYVLGLFGFHFGWLQCLAICCACQVMFGHFKVNINKGDK